MTKKLILWTAVVISVGWFGTAVAQGVVGTLHRVNATVATAKSAPSSSGGNQESNVGDKYLTKGSSLYHHMTDRDPFTPLVRGTLTGKQKVKDKYRGNRGLSRFTVDACSLEAIIKTNEGTFAWFQGPDSKAYKVKVGGHFADGVVLNISSKEGKVVIQQELSDPTAIKPFRNLVLKIRNEKGEGQ